MIFHCFISLQRNERNNLQAIQNFLKNYGINASLKGSFLMYNGNSYDPQEAMNLFKIISAGNSNVKNFDGNEKIAQMSSTDENSSNS